MALAPARAAFMPPPTPGLGRAVALALLAHAALVAALSFAVQWRHSAPEPVTFVAELWATVPVEAAPPAPETPPMEAAVEPPPAPAPPQAVPEPPKLADIALEKKKAQQEAKKKQDLEKDLAQLEKDKAEKLRAEKEKSAKLKEEKLKDEKRLKAEKAAQAARKKELAQAKQDEAQSAQRVKEQTERALRLAAAAGNGDPHASGTAAQSAGPSASYGAKIVAAVRPNITLLNDVAGNPSVEYDVYTDPSGNVLSVKLRKTSGNPYWDETAKSAIEKTAKLPRDENGRVPSPMTIGLKPKPQ
jgi:colicin import membrane protein